MAKEIRRCVILGAAPVKHAKSLKGHIQKQDYLICADGGYRSALAMELVPNLLIGDFDSYTDVLPKQIEIIRLPVCKDDTDMMFSVKEGLRRGYEDFLLLGGIGGRLDHTIANLCTLQYLAEQGACGRLIDEKNEAFVLLSGQRLTLNGKEGDLVSVFPFGAAQCEVTYQGLQYPMTRGVLTNSGDPMGVSNCMTAGEATVLVHSGPALVLRSMD